MDTSCSRKEYSSWLTVDPLPGRLSLIKVMEEGRLRAVQEDEGRDQRLGASALSNRLLKAVIILPNRVGSRFDHTSSYSEFGRRTSRQREDYTMLCGRSGKPCA